MRKKNVCLIVFFIVLTIQLTIGSSFGREFPWPTFLPAITTHAEPKSSWGVLTKVSCLTTPLTFSVTLDGVTKSSVMRPYPLDIEGTYSEWVITIPGEKKISWQATCPSYPTGWRGNFNHTFKDRMKYLLILDQGAGGQPVIKMEER